jgi:hypothetical protein
VAGAAGSNACPAGSARIETEDACRAAVTAAGNALGSLFSLFEWTDPTYPRGCSYEIGTNDAFFNDHAVGAGYQAFQPLCAVVTTGAPPLARRSVGAPARACAATRHVLGGRCV